MPKTRDSALHVLTINPGSTSTKVALFRNTTVVDSYEVKKHCSKRVSTENLDLQLKSYIRGITRFLRQSSDVTLDAVVGRGGFINRDRRRIKSGVYVVAQRKRGQVVVNEAIVRSVMANPELDHPCNLGIPLAAHFAEKLQVPAFTVDPVVCDDYPPVARLSGYPSIERRSTAHVLSVKTAGRKAAEKLGKPLGETAMVVVHLGGGITVAALKNGKMIDNNISLLGGGPFTPQRAGGLPVKAVMDLCYSGRFTQKELEYELSKRGGMIAYLGEDNVQAVEVRIADGDRHARLVLDAMAYQVAKEIGSMAVVAGPGLDAVVATGGIAYSKRFMGMVRKRVAHLAPLLVFPGSLEMEAMARGAIRAFKGEEKAIVLREA